MLAQEEARLLNHSFIGTEHILLGLIHEGEGVAAKALEQLGVTLETVREKVEETIGLSGTAPTGSPPFTLRAKKALELSLREALQLGHNYIGTEHILLGLVREGEGVAAQVLISLGADLAKVRQQVIQLLSGYHQGLAVEQHEASSATNPRASAEYVGKAATVQNVGNGWTARVVRAGRTPTDYAEAYEELAELLAEHGVELDNVEPDLLVVTSVDTNEGPGLAFSVTHELEEGNDDAGDDTT